MILQIRDNPSNHLPTFRFDSWEQTILPSARIYILQLKDNPTYYLPSFTFDHWKTTHLIIWLKTPSLSVLSHSHSNLLLLISWETVHLTICKHLHLTVRRHFFLKAANFYIWQMIENPFDHLPTLKYLTTIVIVTASTQPQLKLRVTK